jgi:hypothetical protein
MTLSNFRIGLNVSGLRPVHVALLMSLLPLCITRAGADDLAVKAGTKNSRFAILLAGEGVRVDADNLSWMEGKLDDCRLRGIQKARLTDEGLRLVKLFSTYMCKPWLSWWERSLGPCDQTNSPRWCGDEDAYLERLNADGYFSAMTIALQENAGPLERYNLIYIMMSALTANVVSELPESEIDKWLRGAMPLFLGTASPDEAIWIGELFQTTGVGVLPTIAETFTAFVEGREEITEEQRTALLEIAGGRFEE